MEDCRVCGLPLHVHGRYENSDWCIACVTVTLDEQAKSDTHKINHEIIG